MSAPTLTWEDPPPEPVVARDRRWLEISKQLQARPGKWAVVACSSSHRNAVKLASEIRRQGPRVKGMLDGCYAAKAATVDGEHRVYAQFLTPLPAPR